MRRQALFTLFPIAALAAAPYCLPGQSCFPKSAQITAFNASISGKLTMPPPYGSVCYQGNWDAKACANLVQNKSEAAFRENIPAAVMYILNEFDENGNGCPVPNTVPNEPLTGECVLGGLATYIVEATTAQDVSKAVKFAAQYNLRLRIKNTGHDYFGRSTAPGAFTIRTRNIQDAEHIPSFIPASCSSQFNVLAIGAGFNVTETYDLAEQNNVISAGGFSPSVGAAGGFLLGGGIAGPVVSKLGFAVDTVVQFDVVLADGTITSANACQNTDLFWALRGGGGAFAVVTKAYLTAAPAAAAVNAVVGTITAPSASVYSDLITALFSAEQSIRGNFTTCIFEASNLTLAVACTRTFDTAAEVEPTQQSLTILQPLTSVTGVVSSLFPGQFPTLNQAYKNLLLPIILTGDLVGVNLLLENRILPETALTSPAGRANMITLFNTLPAEQPIILEWVAGNATTKVATDATAIHPGWRSSVGYVALPVFDPNNGPVSAQSNATIDSLTVTLDKLVGTASYYNEDNKRDDNYEERFWGSNYARLLEIKKKVDPKGVFTCTRCVGAEVFGV